MQKDLATTTFEVFCVVIRAGWEPQQIYSNYFLRLKNQWAIFCIFPSTPNGSENLVRVPSSIQNLVSIPSCLCNLGKEIENRKGRGHDPFLFFPSATAGDVWQRKELSRLQLLLDIFLSPPACLCWRRGAPEKQLLFFVQDSAGKWVETEPHIDNLLQLCILIISVLGYICPENGSNWN